MASALYVGNLPLGVKGAELQTFCHGVGTPTVISVKIQKHKDKNKDASSCYGNGTTEDEGGLSDISHLLFQDSSTSATTTLRPPPTPSSTTRL